MATVSLIIKGSTEPKGIYLRVRSTNIDITVKTGYKIESKFWSKEKGKEVKPTANFEGVLNLKNNLNDLKSAINKELNNIESKGIQPTKELIEQTINVSKGVETINEYRYLTECFKEYMEHLPMQMKNNKKGVSTGTIKNYNTTLNRLLKFENENQKIELRSIDMQLHRKYLKFANDTLNLNPNSIGKDISQIKTVCRYVRDYGATPNPIVFSSNFYSPTNSKEFVCLNNNEIDAIKTYSGVEHLENARDWLIIGCWTAARGSDMLKFNTSNIVELKDNAKGIKYTQSKTGKTVIVPIHKDILEIINKRTGFPRQIDLIHYNRYIKEVCKRVGLTEEVKGTLKTSTKSKMQSGMFPKYKLVSSHIGRRSFATNHYRKLPNQIIMALTGHATEKMFLKYIGETNDDHINDFTNLWETIENNTPKENLLRKA